VQTATTVPTTPKANPFLSASQLNKPNAFLINKGSSFLGSQALAAPDLVKQQSTPAPAFP